MFQLPLHHKLKNIFLHVLKDKIELIVILDDFIKLDDVGMMQLFEYFNLIEANTLIPIGVFLFHFLYSNNLFRFFIYGLDD
jgi:hypothetical protein